MLFEFVVSGFGLIRKREVLMKGLYVFAGLIALSLLTVGSPAIADDRCPCPKVKATVECAAHTTGHVVKTVVFGVPAAVLQTSGDALETTGKWWNRTGNRAFGLLKRRDYCHH